MGEDGQGFSLVVFVLQSGQEFLPRRILTEEADRRFRAGPCELRLADFGPGRSCACAMGDLGTRDEATRGGNLLDPREAGDVMDVVEQHEAEHFAHAGHGLQEGQGMGVMVRGGVEDGAFDGAQHRIRVPDKGAVDFDTFCTAGSAQRAATPSRLAVEALFLPIAGRLSWLLVFGTCARSSPRLCARGIRRRSRSRVARIWAG